MLTDHRAELARIKTFRQLIAYLRDGMGWPIARDSFEDVDDLFYDFTADELGIDPKTAAKIQEIKRLRPLSPKQPWGIFFVKFEPKKLPVVVLRRILSQVALKKRASANSAERAAWAADDLLFVSNYGEGDERQISFAHFSRAQDGHDLPTLKVLGWDNLDTALHLDAVARELSEHLTWPDDDGDAEVWRSRWRAAFTLRHREVVTTSKELSIRLAELARTIRDRIRTALAIETDKGPLTRLMKAFQAALVHDLDVDGFADMYAQTIAYGLLSARIADPHKKTADDFAAHMRTNPFLRELMETFLKVGGRRGKAGGPGIDFDELGVSEVIELLDDAKMEAVVRDFGDRNPQEDPVIHFYELFLKEYDAEKRLQRGVFYTPRPVVSYIVRSVDELLRTEFGLADGLADTTSWGEMAKRHKELKIPDGVSPEQDFVQILDPATGTGTFLVEGIDLIHKMLVEKWKAQGHGERQIDALWNEYVPKHLLTRLHGYELLMAPYAIAHLKIGLKLYETGYRFGSDERARVYLTNALEPAHDFSGHFDFAIPALAHEAAAVNEIKRDKRFTVVIGNPPYAGYSANDGQWIEELMERYKATVRGEERQIQRLSNDYVKFIRCSERLLANTGTGCLGFITDNGYLNGILFRDMRGALRDTFPNAWIYNLHGVSMRGADRHVGVDENVFDITQGVAISILSRVRAGSGDSRYTDLIGSRQHKYTTLSRSSVSTTHWTQLEPKAPKWFFVPTSSDEDYELWPLFTEIIGSGVPKNDRDVRYGTGIKTRHDEFVIGWTPQDAISRVRQVAHRGESDAVLIKKLGLCTTAHFSIRDARRRAEAPDLARHVKPIAYRPFDWRYVVYLREFICEPKAETMRNMLRSENLAMAVLRRDRKENGAGFFVARGLIAKDLVSNLDDALVWPLYCSPEEDALLVRHGDNHVGLPNIARRVIVNLTDRLGLNWCEQGRGDLSHSVGAEDIFNYTYAVFHSPAYRSRYAEFLKIDFPRLPLTESKELFRTLARLGGELVALQLLESHKLAKPITELIGGRSPQVEKVSWAKNAVWIDKAQTAGFMGVREDVWNFHIGGYQVCEKWLKVRKGRTLSKDEIAHYQKIVVALAETIRLMKEIDEVIEQHGGWPGAFQIGEVKAAVAKVLPFRLRTVEPKPEERYVACVPLVPLKAAAGAFGDPQHFEDEGFEWVAVESRHRLRPGMFVAQVVGKSMEPAIPDGAYCLFRAQVEGTRQGKTLLVQLRDATDAETGQRYTVKRYESEKAVKGDSWRHERIALKPINPDFEPIVLTDKNEMELQVIAEVVDVLGTEYRQ